MTDKLISARISLGLAERLAKATDRERDPYAPSLSQVIKRGLELALKELDVKRKK